MIPLLLFLAHARAGAPTEARAEMVRPTPPPADDGLSVLVLHQMRAVNSNVVTTNPFLDGQVVGRLGGTNGTTVLTPKGLDLDGDGEKDEDIANSAFVEQRASAFFGWAPPTMNGQLGINAGFEIDFLWGDQSYNTGGNVGGGFGGDQVNLQTRRLNAVWKPNLGKNHKLEVVGGLQFVADGVHNPANARPDDLFRTGGGLKFWGSEGAGLSAYGTHRDGTGDRLKYRLGRYNLSEGGAGLSDDVVLNMVDLAVRPDFGLWLGLHGWLLNDASGGSSGILGVGPTSQLSGLQGGPNLDLRAEGEEVSPEVDARFFWVGADIAWNHRLDQGRVGATAQAFVNGGSIYVPDATDVTVQGWLAETEFRARIAPGSGSVLRLGALAASRDGTGPTAYTGVLTGNSYGIAGAFYATHGCYLLFPDRGAINRLSPVVADVSNRGKGLIAATGSVAVDVVPGKFNVTVGGGWARGTEQSPVPLGTEANARLSYKPWLFSDLSLSAAKLYGSEVPQADGSPLPGDPWTLILSMDNLLF